MSAFQDFGPLSERRRAERQQAERKRLVIISGSISVIALIAVLGVGAVVYSTQSTTTATTTTSSRGPVASTQSSTQLRSTSKSVKVICSPTTYPRTCESKLMKRANRTTTTKDLIRASVSIVIDELSNAANEANLIDTQDPQVQGAIDDCKELLGYAVKELNNTLNTIDKNKINKLPDFGHEMRNWLSAVMSYQYTCIDGFPEGELKKKMADSMKVAKQLTSNALAIVGKVSAFLAYLKVPGFGRRLLGEKQKVKYRDIDGDGFPVWLSREERILANKVTKNMKANVTVDKEGKGDYKTINEALMNVPKKYKGRYVIYVKAGVYEESVLIPSSIVNLTIYGDGSRKSIVTGSKNFVDGTRTFQTATFAVVGDGFIAMAMGFRNTAGAAKHQAVAIRVQSDHSIFLNCYLDGYQDTLYAQTHRQFYHSCIITGTIDFIFGDAAAILQNCILILRRPLDNQQNIITAQGRTDSHEITGFVLHKCKIEADPELVPTQNKVKSYLGRPWKLYSRTIIMESTIPGFIQKDGYMPWDGDFALKTLYYAEYKNEGAGANTSGRVKWPGVKVIGDKNDAMAFSVAGFIHGQDWIKAGGAPVRLTLYN